MSNRDTLIISLLTLLTVILWTVFEAYHVYTTSTIPKSLSEQVVQITPTLNRALVEKIKNGIDLENLPTPAAISPTPAASGSATAAPSALTPTTTP